MHILDVILSERSRVKANDQAISQEEEAAKGTQIGLYNVFKLANQDESNDEEPDSNEPIDQAERLPSTELASVATEPGTTHDRRD